MCDNNGWQPPCSLRLQGETVWANYLHQHISCVIAVVVLVLFGGKKLPELGKGLGEGYRGFKDGLKGVSDDINKPGDTAHTVTPKPEESVK